MSWTPPDRTTLNPAIPEEAATLAGHRPGSDAWLKAVERERRQLAEWQEAAETARALWDKTFPASPDHPYLRRKGVLAPNGDRPKWWPREYRGRPVQDDEGRILLADGDLVIAMKGIEDGNPLMSLQRVPADPKRNKLFLRNARAGRCFNSFLSHRPRRGDTLYVAEGWATGWTIHHVTAAPVAIAFSSGNLEAVAVEMRRRYPDVRIVVAADNDWRNAHNAGVVSARDAAAACRGEVAIPDFVDRSGGPSDFNDIYLLEGPDAVRRWLDPARAGDAAISPPAPAEPAPPSPPAPPPPPPPQANGPEYEPPPDEDEPGPVQPDDRPRTWQDRAPFRCLGYDRGVYYYLPRGTGQIADLTAAQHDKKWLLPLANASWWTQEFPAAKGVDWFSAADAMLRASERAGVYRPERLRGRGCWPERTDDGQREILLHLGDRLLPPGAKSFVDPEEYEGSQRLIYERLGHLRGPSTKRAMDVEEAREVLSLFEDLLWHDDASGALLAGWTVLAPICGALTWRPHVWVTGGAGGGKSTVLKDLVVPLLGGPIPDGGMARYYEGGSTEAGIRQELRADAVPVVYDEAEQQDAKSDARIQAVLALARSASSTEGAHTAKGTTGGHAMSFQVRSMFCLASIGGAVRQEADKSRIALLQLKSKGAVDPDERREHWARYAPRLARITVEHGRELFARTLRWLRDGRLDETIKVFRAAAAVVLGDQRSGDQYGTLFSGTWTLMAEEPPTAEEARELVASHGLGTYVAEQAPEGLKVLRVILQQEVRVDTTNGPRSFAVGQLVDACMTKGSPLQDDAERWLRAHGILCTVDDGERTLELANTSQWIGHMLRETPYADGWYQQLRTLPGVRSGPPKRFHGGLTSRTTLVPKGAYD